MKFVGMAIPFLCIFYFPFPVVTNDIPCHCAIKNDNTVLTRKTLNCHPPGLRIFTTTNLRDHITSEMKCCHQSFQVCDQIYWIMCLIFDIRIRRYLFYIFITFLLFCKQMDCLPFFYN